MRLAHAARYLPVAGILGIWLAVSFAIFYYSPEGIVDFIGIKNAYLFLFVLAFLSGVSVFGGVPYHLVLIAFAAGGLDPLLLGAAAAAGVMLGDSTSYLVGYRSSAIVPRRAAKHIERLSAWLGKYPGRAPLFFLLYGSLVPFSNDFVGISMGLARVPFVRVMVPLAIGNLIFSTSLAYLSPYLYGVLYPLLG